MADEVVSLKQLDKYFDGLEKALTTDVSFEGFFDRAELAIKTAALNCFDQGVDPWGNPWAPVKFRVRDAGGVLQPLRDRGLLMASMTADNGQGAIRERGNDFLRYGTNIEYAGVHNFGHTQTPKQAKFLCIPATLEAMRCGSPRNFPRPLTPRINASKDGGVLIEERISGKKQHGPVQQPPPKTAAPAMTMPKPKEPKAEKPPKTFGPLNKKEQKEANREARDNIVQYYMTTETIIPARPFIGFTDTLANKCILILDDWLLGQGSAVSKYFTSRAA